MTTKIWKQSKSNQKKIVNKLYAIGINLFWVGKYISLDSK